MAVEGVSELTEVGEDVRLHATLGVAEGVAQGDCHQNGI